MQTSDFDYFLPPELIAQHPASPRDSSRLLFYDRNSDSLNHQVFSDIVDCLPENTMLVFNQSKVISARFWAEKLTGASIEILYLNAEPDHCFKALCKPGKRLKPGDVLIVPNTPFRFEVMVKGKECLLKNLNAVSMFDILDQIGVMPLPPYIKRAKNDPGYQVDQQKYQTVYAQEKGSVAAPTAGLHFTQPLLEKMKAKGIALEYVTLHVGAGTFMPVQTDRIEDHPMHSEWYSVSDQSALNINRAKMDGKKIIAVGTTSIRTLESASSSNGVLTAGSDSTDIMISPGYSFKMIDGMITNFHLPKSTLIMLVSAYLGREKTLDLYRRAVEQKYRFYSYGDAMLLL